jgi:hypothetical protein
MWSNVKQVAATIFCLTEIQELFMSVDSYKTWSIGNDHDMVLQTMQDFLWTKIQQYGMSI